MDKISMLSSWWGGSGVVVQTDPSVFAPEENKENDGSPVDCNDQEGVEIMMDGEIDKAISSAKNWGSYLYSFASTATKKVSATASRVRTQLEENTIMGEFSREQEKFAHEQRHSVTGEDPVPPWVGYGDEEGKMREQMLALSTDKRNFVRNPPLGVDFHFDYDTCSSVALATLDVDENLKAMRFELVPKHVSEETFWRNYFYRVSLIKQSSQLTQKSGETMREKSQEDLSNRAGDKVQLPRDIPIKSPDQGVSYDDHHPDSPTAAEFASDAFAGSELNVDDVRRDMEQLGMDDSKNPDMPSPSPDEDVPEWEVELQQELQEYEVVDEDQSDPVWEQEIQKMLEAEDGS